jgi:CRISPR/Cas system-associated endoribonuclease Cas2
VVLLEAMVTPKVEPEKLVEAVYENLLKKTYLVVYDIHDDTLRKAMREFCTGGEDAWLVKERQPGESAYLLKLGDTTIEDLLRDIKRLANGQEFSAADKLYVLLVEDIVGFGGPDPAKWTLMKRDT